MTKRYLPLLAWLAVVGRPSTGMAQPVGPEFQVNTYTTGDQGSPAVASDASGNFVVVWGGNGELVAQRYDGDGNALGGEFQVSTSPNPYWLSVSSDATGNFVVVWAHRPDVFPVLAGQLFDSSGNRVGDELLGIPGAWPSVASDTSGNFVVVWEHDEVRERYDVFGQRYDSSGHTIGGRFQVNTVPAGPQSTSSVAFDPSGNFVVAWSNGWFPNGDGSGYGVFGQRYDSDGNALGGEFQVNTYTTNNQGWFINGAPSVAADASGNFVVVWASTGQDGSGDGVFGQRYDNNGNPSGAEFQVNTHIQDDQRFPSIASDASGNFVVVWTSANQDGSLDGVFGQRYDNNGNPSGAEFQVNTYTTGTQIAGGYQINQTVSSDKSGDFVVTWGSSGQDGSGYGVFGQRFSAGCEASLQVGGDVHTPGSRVPVQVHIAHHRPKTVTVPWELRLLDADGQRIVRHKTEPHTFEPGDVVDRNVEFRLPDALAAGTYTLELAISGMAGTKGTTTTFRVVRAE